MSARQWPWCSRAAICLVTDARRSTSPGHWYWHQPGHLRHPKYDCPFLRPSSDKQTGADVGGNCPSMRRADPDLQSFLWQKAHAGLTSVIRETKFCWHASLKYLLLYKSSCCSQWVESPKSPQNTAGDGSTRKGHFLWQELAWGRAVQRVQSQRKRTSAPLTHLFIQMLLGNPNVVQQSIHKQLN